MVPVNAGPCSKARNCAAEYCRLAFEGVVIFMATSTDGSLEMSPWSRAKASTCLKLLK
ncbi:hypothetical protein D9M68_847400 [compost metagenome]